MNIQIDTVVKSIIHKIHKAIYPFLKRLADKRIGYKLIILNQYKPVSEKPIIFAVNHSGCKDAPISLKAIDKHCYILAGKQRLTLTDKIFLQLNGVIWVDRKDKNSRKNAKSTIQMYLKQGKNILWFPEGTWNLSENLPMLPMKWGIIEAAGRGGAQIIPLVLEYQRDKEECYVLFGQPIVILEEDINPNKIGYLRDIMAGLRWTLWERNPIQRSIPVIHK